MWLFIPMNLLACVLGVPGLLGVPLEACATVGVTMSLSMLVAALIDSQAVHALFFPPTSARTHFVVPSWLRGVNWLVAPVIGHCLLSLAVLKAGSGRTRELVLAFVGINFLVVQFAIGCMHNAKASGRSARSGLYAASMGPIIFYAAVVAYISATLDSSLLSFVVSTDIAVVLSFPFLNAFAFDQHFFLREAASPVDRCGKTVSDCFPVATSRLAYLMVFLVSLTMASPERLLSFISVMMQKAVPYQVPSLQENRIALEAPGAVWRSIHDVLTLHVQVTVGQVAGLSLGLLSLLCCCAKTQQGEMRTSSAAAIARRRLTKLRATSKLFPGPYPDGWYVLCKSEQVPSGQVVAMSACDTEFAVFRGANGKVGVLHAFCPHLGTHLGEGGSVEGNAVVCPYHSWKFDSDGKCVDIPYCPKKPTERTHSKSYHSEERFGLIFVWLHSQDSPPWYRLTMLDEIEEKGMEFCTDVPCENWQMHLMEPSQNAADPYHFNTVHSWLGAPPGQRGTVWARHECSSKLGTMDQTDPDGKVLEDSVIMINEKVVEMKLWGIIPMPKFMSSHYASGAKFQGPAISTFFVDSPKLGSLRILVCWTPESPFEQRCIVRSFCTPGFFGPLARLISRTALATIEQDRQVWENKLAVAPRNLVSGDGPFAAYGVWLKQFYSENSKTWGEQSLDW